MLSNEIRPEFSDGVYPFPMSSPVRDSARIGFGMRLKAARERKNLTQTDVADKFETNKGTVSSWETGRADPGVFRLRALSKLYGVSADALLWENSLTPEAMQMAAMFDALTERQKSTLRALWMAYIQESTSDSEVESKMPITKQGNHTH